MKVLRILNLSGPELSVLTNRLPGIPGRYSPSGAGEYDVINRQVVSESYFDLGLIGILNLFQPDFAFALGGEEEFGEVESDVGFG